MDVTKFYFSDIDIYYKYLINKLIYIIIIILYCKLNDIMKAKIITKKTELVLNLQLLREREKERYFIDLNR